tara:strand:+ start:41498 stop:41815 length:318 start_codon:yes stop_codon:yes gene_type:complete
VNYHVAKVDQNPAAFSVAFLVAWGNSSFLEFMPKALHDCAELQWRVCCCQDKIVCEARSLTNVEERDVLSLELREKIYDPVGKGLGFQSASSTPPAAEIRMVAQR